MKKNHDLVKTVSLCLALVLVCGGGLLLTKFNFGSQTPAATIPPASSTSASAPTKDVPATTVTVTGVMEKKELPDLLEDSSLVIRGTVSDISAPFQIEGVGGGVSVFTDYKITVRETFRGEAFDTVTVRLQGGQAGDLNVECPDEPKLAENNNYVLFLYQPGRGGGYNTEGDYYYITGLNQGVFERNPLPRAGQEIYTAMSPESTEITQIEFSQELETANTEIPVNKNAPREEFLKNIQWNLDTGFIQQEEYDRLLADSQKYATILE